MDAHALQPVLAVLFQICGQFMHIRIKLFRLVVGGQRGTGIGENLPLNPLGIEQGIAQRDRRAK